MPKRSQKGITSGVGLPNRNIGKNGDMTFRLTRKGYILYVKENSQWHAINTGVDILKLRKEVDRLIKSVSVLGKSSNQDSLVLSSLRIAKNIALATADPKITFSIGTSDKFVMGVDDSDSDKLKIDTGGTIGGATKVTLDDSGNMTTAGLVTATKFKPTSTSPGQGEIGAAAADSHFIRTNDGSVNYYTLIANASNVVQGNPTGGALIFIDNLLTIVDNADANKGFAIDVSSVTSGQTRTLNVPDSNGTIALTSTTVSDFGANAAFKIDADQPATTAAEDSIGLHIDYDRAVATSGTNNHNDTGIDLDVNAATLGTGTVMGMDIDVVGATSGTHTAVGIDLDVDSADTNIGMIINTAGTHMKLVANADANDYATFTLADTGDLTIATVGSGTTDSDMILDADGDIEINADGGNIIFKDASTELLEINATAIELPADIKLTFDGSTAEDYIYGDNTNIYIAIADSDVLTVEPNQVKSDKSIGFAQFTPTYNASDTEVNYKTSGNKAFCTFGAGNITDMNLNFPSVSGNFILLLKQDGTGSRSVTNWKAFDSAGNAANGSATVKWAGGSNPSLTSDANHVDILSFYWDATNEIAYGAATLDFQF